ncbi:MAG: SDR family NAD(P)-dependent oxidoreductase [Pleurocapsa sp. MO_226.B13]|nr:SDR family NAD(P)-dependent oxidoreductase [Pleurocapsa sp. MO_226.B13]
MIQNKVAVVTGSSRGIGQAIALRLAREGALVIVHYGHSSDEAEETVKAIERANGKAFSLQADMGDTDSIKQFFDGLDAELTQRTGEAKFDILVNNAGTFVTS